MPDIADLTFRQDFYSDPDAWKSFCALMMDVFGLDLGILDRLGGYDKGCMPFGWFDAEGQLVANFTAFPMPIRISGQDVTTLAFQSGAVRPAWRGKGLYRDLMTRAFDWAEGKGFALGLLLTDKPSIYEPHDYLPQGQFQFIGEVPARLGPSGGSRRLSLDRPEDLLLLKRKLDHRTPVSDNFAVRRQSELFLFNARLDPSIRLSLLARSDVVVAWRMPHPRAFHLLDIVGSRIPSIAEIISALNIYPGSVTVHFPPDLLEFQARAYPDDNALTLMVRGDIGRFNTPPFMLSPLAEF